MNVEALRTRMDTVEKWCESMDLELRANTMLTKQVHTNTEEIVELFKASKDMFEFLSKWGKRFAIFMKYAGMIAGGAAAIWALLNARR